MPRSLSGPPPGPDRNACTADRRPRCPSPVTWPEALTATPTLRAPPRVPRSLSGPPSGPDRNAWYPPPAVADHPATWPESLTAWPKL